MIPKTIHYCWFGGAEKPKFAIKCINSWKKHCADYEIIEWNESNYDISLCPEYVKQAYKEKMWAFVADYVRLDIIYKNGGIYFDTDVELVKNIDFLLENKAFFAIEPTLYVNTGCGFGACEGLSILKEMMDDYNNDVFVKEDGSYNKLPCPERNTKVLYKYGYKNDDIKQVILGNILFLPAEYMCPVVYKTGKKLITRNTISIHHYTNTWVSDEWKTERKRRRRIETFYHVLRTPNRLLKNRLGEDKYNRIKRKLKAKK